MTHPGTPARTRWRASRRVLAGALLAVGLAGCDAPTVVLGTPGTGGAHLRSGTYVYRAWSDFGGRVEWSGYVDLRVGADGRLTGTYHLPWQCTDRRGFEADCYGRVGGRLHRDGYLQLGFDEGWLSHEGTVDRFSEVRGRWWTRILGYSDSGTFSLVRR